MGSKRRRLGIVAVLVVGLLALPAASASAKPGYSVFRGGHMVELDEMRASHGFSVGILVRNRKWLEVFVGKRDFSVIYLLRGIDTEDDGIHAALPGVGRIALDFHPRGAPKHEGGFLGPGCRGGNSTIQAGEFSGRIDLAGERGYTSLHASHVGGEVTASEKEVCKRSRQEHGEIRHASLYAVARSPHRAVTFSVTTFPAAKPLEPAEVFFNASLYEWRRGMIVLRSALAHGPADDLVFGDESDFPDSLTATPPAPIHGSGAFERQAGNRGTWTGDLSVTLPGAGLVRLAGTRFQARACQGHACIISKQH
jgi:hypothetical protein